MSYEKSNKGLEENEKEDLPFAKAEVLRLMRENLSSDKIIRERVKVEMNKFLYSIVQEVCRDQSGKDENPCTLECNQI